MNPGFCLTNRATSLIIAGSVIGSIILTVVFISVLCWKKQWYMCKKDRPQNASESMEEGEDLMSTTFDSNQNTNRPEKLKRMWKYLQQLISLKGNLIYEKIKMLHHQQTNMDMLCRNQTTIFVRKTKRKVADI